MRQEENIERQIFFDRTEKVLFKRLSNASLLYVKYRIFVVVTTFECPWVF